MEDIAAKFRFVDIVLIDNKNKMFYTDVLDMFMTYLYTKFHISDSNCSLAIDIKPNIQYRYTLRTAAMFLFYVLHYLKKLHFYFRYIMS